MRLKGKVALITGGARGMGAAEAKLFAQEGAKVVIADVLETEGRQTEAAITETGGDAVFVRVDVTQESDWESAIRTAVDRFGKPASSRRTSPGSLPKASAGPGSGQPRRGPRAAGRADTHLPCPRHAQKSASNYLSVRPAGGRP